MIPRNLVARVKLLSEMHIGTGTILAHDADWIEVDGYVYYAGERLIETIFARAEADGKDMVEVARLLAESTLNSLHHDLKWLKKADFAADSPLFRYRLKGKPATAEIREQIKDVHGRPYLPGSTFKGALRTAIAATAAEELKPNLQRLGDKKEWAGQPVERQLFGPDAHHDFMRALQVGDSQPLPADKLVLCQAHVYPTAANTARGKSKGLLVDVEALPKDAVFELPLHIPTELLADRGTPFDDRRKSELADWEDRGAWLVRLADIGKQQSRSLLAEEEQFFRDREQKEVGIAQKFIADLQRQFGELAPNEFFLVVGWGGGWHTKTLSRAINSEAGRLDRLVEKYHLDPIGEHREGDPFPKSRHLLRTRMGQTGAPLGWVKVTLEEKA